MKLIAVLLLSICSIAPLASLSAQDPIICLCNCEDFFCTCGVINAHGKNGVKKPCCDHQKKLKLNR